MKRSLIALVIGLSSASAFAEGITQYQIPRNNRLPTRNLDGSVTLDISSAKEALTVSQNFYGADNKGFARLPSKNIVNQLELSMIKFGGNIHSSYNWENNTYFDLYSNNFYRVGTSTSSLIQTVRSSYNAEPIFQINMMGWQPVRNANGTLSYEQTADAQHAANFITEINGVQSQGLKNIVMDNEPFHWESTHGAYSPSADEYIEKFIAYVVAMKDAQMEINNRPQDLKIWGPELATGWTGWQTNHPSDCVMNYALKVPATCTYGENGEFSEFIPYFLSKLSAFENDQVNNPNGYKMLDYLTLHYYPLFREQFNDNGSIITKKMIENQNVAGMLASTNVWDNPSYVNRFDRASPLGTNPQILQKFEAWKNGYYPSAKLAVTEFGIDSIENVGYHPIVRPLYLADMLPRLASFGVKNFFHSFLQGGVNGSDWALINGSNKSHLFYMYSLFTTKFKGSTVETQKTYGDEVNTYSVKSGNVITLFVVNKDTKIHNTAVKLQNGSSLAEDMTEVSLEPWSLTVFEIPLTESGTIKVSRYGAKEMGVL